MLISVSEAKTRLTDLVRRAENGEEIVLTRHGRPAVRLSPAVRRVDREARRAVFESLRGSSRLASPGPDAARSQNFLYDGNGLPG
jgi:prevent-host-death family protein